MCILFLFIIMSSIFKNSFFHAIENPLIQSSINLLIISCKEMWLFELVIINVCNNLKKIKDRFIWKLKFQTYKTTWKLNYILDNTFDERDTFILLLAACVTFCKSCQGLEILSIEQTFHDSCFSYSFNLRKSCFT